MDFSPQELFDLSGYPYKGVFNDCSFAWEALKNIQAFLENNSRGLILGDISPKAYLMKPELITIGRNTVVEPGAYIQGPCIIGENCTIRHGAYIRGDVIIGDKSVVGHDSEVKNSILLNGAHAAHFAYVGDSILGNNVNLGAGTKLANLRFDHNEVIIRLDGKIWRTGLKKFGALLGDDSQTGCNCVTNPGTIMGKRALCAPCLNFGGVLKSGARAVSAQRPRITVATH